MKEEVVGYYGDLCPPPASDWRASVAAAPEPPLILV